MIIKARTVYTESVIKKFTKFSMFRAPAQIIKYVVLELLMIHLTVYLLFIPFSAAGEAKIFMLPIVMAVSLFLLAIVPITLLMYPSKMVKLSKKLFNSVAVYEFSENEVFIDSTLPTAVGRTKAGYNYFEITYETKDAFYLFISKQRAYLLNKSDIFEGSAEDLRELLIKNMPPKKHVDRR